MKKNKFLVVMILGLAVLSSIAPAAIACGGGDYAGDKSDK